MRILKVLILTLIGWCCALSLLAQSFYYEGLYYNVLSETEKTAKVTGYNGAIRAFVIPDSVVYNGNKYAVTTIGKEAFKGYKYLTSIDLTNVTTIENQAFYKCINMHSIKLGNVKTIGDAAFYECFQLYSIDLGNVTTIGNQAFYGCSWMPSIDLKNVITIGDNAFYECYGLTSIDLTNVTTIGDKAFWACRSLKCIKAPTNVPSIGRSGFESNTNIYVPYSSKRAYETDTEWSQYNLYFYDICQDETLYQINSLSERTATCLATFNSTLRNMVIPESVEYKGRAYMIDSIASYAFYGCDSLTSINLGNVETIGDKAFDDCSNLKRIKAPTNVPTIGKNLFDSKTNIYVSYSDKGAYETDAEWSQYNLYFYDICQDETLYQINSLSERTATYLAAFYPIPENMVIPESVEYNGKAFKINSIGDGAFAGCSNLTSIDFGNVTTIGDEAFGACRSLPSIDLKNVTTIGDYAFQHCQGLTSIDFGNVTTIGDHAFNSCISLTTIDFGNVTTIGNQTFYFCIGLTSIDFGNVKTIGNQAFEDCRGLTSIDFKNVATIGDHAFFICSNLTSADFGNVTTIGDYAFQYCQSLTSINLKNVKTIGNQAFEGCDALTSIDFKNVTTIGSCAFKDCKALISVDFGNVKSIEDGIFVGCSSLESLILQNVETIEANAFKGHENIKSIHVCTTVPPVVKAESAFERNVYLDATLYVPTGYKKTYEEAPHWKNFFIVESDDLTGIEEVMGATSSTFNIYDLNGRLVKANATGTEGLQPGIYIINGKKVMVK